MDENIPNNFNEETASSVFKAIIYAGLAVGILDGSAAVISSALNGVSPTRVFQYIASALLGRASYDYSSETVLFGVSLHFAAAFSVAAVYFYASRRFPFLTRQTIASGAIYGILVYFVMQLIVKLTLAPPLPFSVFGLVQGIFIHIFFVGLPTAIITRYFANKL